MFAPGLIGLAVCPNLILNEPTSITSPDLSSCTLIGAPFTLVPSAEPRSSIVYTPPFCLNTQCLRDTSASRTGMSWFSWRPRVISTVSQIATQSGLTPSRTTRKVVTF